MALFTKFVLQRLEDASISQSRSIIITTFRIIITHFLTKAIPKITAETIKVSEDGTWTHCRALLCTCREDVKQVQCDHRDLNEIPINIPGDVEQLSLDGAKFSEIPANAFSEYIDLFTLSLSKGELYKITSRSFYGLSDLETLELSFNKFTTLGQPDNLAKTCIIQEIENSHTHRAYHSAELNMEKVLTNQIPNTAFEYLTSLRELYLGFNNIHCISSAVFDVIGKKLLELHLEHNDISKLEDSVFKNLINLERLDLSDNHLEFIGSDAFSGLTKLKELLLQSNQLSWISTGAFKDFSQLTYLKIDRNQFTSLRELQLLHLHSLEIADLQNNNIMKIEETDFAKNIQLTKLFLADNNINNIQDHSFLSNRRLTYIDLRRNHLADISQHSFDGLESLKFLLLDGNRLTTIHERSFYSLNRLISLSLSNNLLHQLHSDTFLTLKKLQYLNLGENRLMVPKQNWFNISNPAKLFTSTTEFVLTGNSWRCDCSMYNFKKWENMTRFKEGKYKRQIDEQLKTLFCKTPYYYKGKHIKEIPLEAFTCTTSSHVEHTVEDFKPLISFSVLVMMFLVCFYKIIRHLCFENKRLSAKQIQEAILINSGSGMLDLDKHKQI